MPKPKYRERLAKHTELIAANFERVHQAPISGEFWIVRRINLPSVQFQHFFGVPFRHPTIESAQHEANRQARRKPEELFGIFHFTGLVGVVEPSAVLAACEMARS